jgi:hypothetical protein
VSGTATLGLKRRPKVVSVGPPNLGGIQDKRGVRHLCPVGTFDQLKIRLRGFMPANHSELLPNQPGKHIRQKEVKKEDFKLQKLCK